MAASITQTTKNKGKNRTRNLQILKGCYDNTLMILRFTDFLDFVRRPIFLITQCRKLHLFPSLGERVSGALEELTSIISHGDALIQLGPLERANLCQWICNTMIPKILVQHLIFILGWKQILFLKCCALQNGVQWTKSKN